MANPNSVSQRFAMAIVRHEKTSAIGYFVFVEFKECTVSAQDF
jgi:hypothetical protein